MKQMKISKEQTKRQNAKHKQNVYIEKNINKNYDSYADYLKKLESA